MPRIECQGCGYSLEVPAAVGEGAEFACGHCALVLRNVEAARSFRWHALEPYIREHGASRLNLWGGMIGASVWLFIFAGVAIAIDEFRASMMLALALPYLALLAVLFRGRARTPAAVWARQLWTGLGAYGLYLSLLLTLVPEWWRTFEAVGGNQPPPLVLGLGSAALLLYGLVGTASYRRRASRLPKAHGDAPSQERSTSPGVSSRLE